MLPHCCSLLSDSLSFSLHLFLFALLALNLKALTNRETFPTVNKHANKSTRGALGERERERDSQFIFKVLRRIPIVRFFCPFFISNVGFGRAQAYSPLQEKRSIQFITLPGKRVTENGNVHAPKWEKRLMTDEKLTSQWTRIYDRTLYIVNVIFVEFNSWITEIGTKHEFIFCCSSLSRIRLHD